MPVLRLFHRLSPGGRGEVNLEPPGTADHIRGM